MGNPNGSRFIWFDLMAKDSSAAKAFYGDIIGWNYEKFPGGDYEVVKAGDKGVGGVMALPKEMISAGVPQHWMGYVYVDDVDATVKKIEKMGGKVHKTPEDIPTVGRFAVVADPQGAAFALFKPQPSSTELAPRELIGNFSWAELNTTDWESAWKFYSEVFGWKKTDSMNMGPEIGEYFMFTAGSDTKSMGGMSNAAKGMNAPPHWLFYTNVKNADATAKRVSEKGGKIVAGPMDVPGGDRIAMGMDPQGGMFAIYSSGAKR